MNKRTLDHWARRLTLTAAICSLGPAVLAQQAPTPPALPDDDAPVASTELRAMPAKDDDPALPPAPSPQDPPPPPPLAPFPGSWVTQGPGPIRFGQTENVSPNNEVAGAIHTVVAHPTNADILYIGAVNGGIWKTTNGTAASPTWTSQTDTHGSLSIGALDFDPTDGTHNTLWAGIGRFSSLGSRGGDRLGLLRTTDGGTIWTAIDGGGTLVGKNISGLAARGSTVVVSVNIADSFTFGNIGIFRSTNSGASFTQIGSGNGAGTGLPGGLCHDLATDPSNNNVLYTSVIYGDTAGGTNGVFKSTDQGATWTKVSSAAMDANLITGTTSNVEITVGNSGQVFVGIVNSGQLQNGGVYHSPSGNTGTWVAMDVPLVNEGGGNVGTNPRFKKDAGIPGGQGAIHFSIRADPVDPNVVYVGGDRQPRGFNDAGSWPNALGATNFTGRLFRGDASVTPTGGAPSPQWEHLTHTQGAGGMPGGGTASNSAPHADSREMAFDANNELIQVDDGGIYRRTSPANNTGDWFSINGNLQVTEAHSVAYDTLSDIIITGNQDTGVSQQSASGSLIWDEVSQGDGGDVAVTPDPGNASQSIRYSSPQFLGTNGLWRSVYNASGALVTRTYPSLTPLGGAPAMTGQFYTPLEANRIDPNRLLFGGGNGVYESTDQGSSVSRISTAVVNQIVGNPMICGGRRGGSDNADLIYVAVGSDIHKRTTSGGALVSVGGYSGGTVRGIIADNEDWMTLFAIDDDSKVYQTTNGGTSFSDITGDLPSHELNSIEFIRSGAVGAVVVGTHQGVYVALSTNYSEWALLGTNMPDAPIWDMQYDPADDVLAVSSLGRGVWTFPGVAATLTAGPNFVLDATPDSLEICAPASAIYTVDIASVMGFSDPVTLSLTGNPAGTTVNFSPNPVTPGTSSTLTISNTVAATSGSYNMQVDGLGGVILQSDTVTLDLVTAPPAPIILISPANGEIGVSLKPTLTWSTDPLPVTNTVEIDDDPAFGSVDFSVVTANATSTVGSELNPDTLFYWRVTAQNLCGATVSGTGAFVTRITHSTSPSVAIPDGNATGISDDLVVADGRTIADLDLAVKINHTYVGDLTVTLTHLDTGTTVVVLDRPGVPDSTYGSSGDNLDIILDDEASLVAEDDWDIGDPAYIICGHYQPSNVLSAFDGESLNGTWRLTVTDVVTPDPGTLVSWGLHAEQVGQPELVVELVGDNLTSGVSTLDFGELLSGTTPTADLVLTIRNTGTGELTGLGTSFSGPDAADFSATSIPGTLLPGQNTTVTVTFAAGSAGNKTAHFHLASNDQDENPFDLALTGTLITQTSLQSWAASFGLSGSALLYDADDDGDFVRLLEEYAFNLDPTVPDGFEMAPGGSSGLPLVSLVGERLRIEFLRRRSDPDLIYTPEFGSDLTIGLPDGFITATEPEVITDIDLNFLRSIIDDSVDGTTHSLRFGRVKLEYPDPGP